MSANNSDSSDLQFKPPPIERTPDGDISTASLAGIIQWFLDFDERVAIIKHPSVEEIFQLKQEQSQRDDEDVFIFNRAEDRLAIGILQALAEYRTEQQLHIWISKLLNALEEATKFNEEAADSYGLDKVEADSAVKKAAAIPTERGRTLYLNSCWLEALCTAEIRVLGWIYKELYGRPFAPGNF